MAEGSITVVPIRYDGLDADAHQIELTTLGESLQGIARIIGVSSHFLITFEYAKQLQALDVRVLVQEPKANCFSIHAVVEFAQQHQILSGSFGATLCTLVTWLIHRASNNQAEMKAIKDSLDKAIAQLAGQDIVPRMLSTMDKLAEGLRPSLRMAVAPIGKSCREMRIGTDAVIDEATAEAIRSTADDEVTDEQIWNIRLTELDIESRTAKARFTDDEDEDARRIKVTITDPSIEPYLTAFANQSAFKAKGKGILRDGEIHTLYISDIG